MEPAALHPSPAVLELLNPLTPADVLAWRGQVEASKGEAKVMPAEFAATVASLDPLKALALFKGDVLVLSGPADRIARAESAEQYITAARSAGRRAAHLRIACGDHALSDPLARQAAIEQIMQFSKTRG